MNTSQQLVQVLEGMTTDGQWRVRMSVFELVADLGLLFGQAVFAQKLQTIFLSYMSNTAAAVREMGVTKSALLAREFREDWITKEFLPQVQQNYHAEKKGYNYRICCLHSLATVMPYIRKDHAAQQIIPIFVLAFQDQIPNVKFCVCQIINQNRQHIDDAVFSGQLAPPLRELAANDTDTDVVYYAQLALYGIQA